MGNIMGKFQKGLQEFGGFGPAVKGFSGLDSTRRLKPRASTLGLPNYMAHSLLWYSLFPMLSG